VDHALALGLPLVSDDTLAETAEVLSRPRFDPFDRYVPLTDRQRFLQLLGGVARRVVITHRMQACRDPRDDRFLQLALNGEAEAIVTGDRDLLALDPFHRVRILRPADFCGVA
jgi:putative PIN family toxin of toxin-antitoxin system